MNRNDLEDLISYDTDAIAFFGVGSFMLSGSAWILVEQFLGDNGVWTDDGIHMNALTWTCLAAALFGAFMVILGYRQHSRKRARITRIFSEASPRNSTSASGGSQVHNASA